MFTLPRKVKAVTPICLGPSISKMAGDTDLVTMENRYGESNGHVTDVVTWPERSSGMLVPITSKTAGDSDRDLVPEDLE